MDLNVLLGTPVRDTPIPNAEKKCPPRKWGSSNGRVPLYESRFAEWPDGKPINSLTVADAFGITTGAANDLIQKWVKLGWVVRDGIVKGRTTHFTNWRKA